MSENTAAARIGVVIVSYGHERDVVRLVDSFADQLREGDRVVAVDNKRPWVLEGVAGEALREHGVIIVEHDNGGFAAGCNIGAEAVVDDVDLLFFLNPDTLVEDPKLLDTLRSGVDTDYAAWMPYLLLPDGTINSAGNALHISGLSWVEGLGELPQLSEGWSDISVASGACLVVRTEWWRRLGGMEETYFMYHEDTDFSARLLLAGARVGLCHGTSVTHDYDYAKGDYKWIYIERNRHVLILSVWPTSVIAVLAPQILAVNLALWLIAAKEGRLRLKLKSLGLLLRGLPETFRLRKKVQPVRKVSGAEYLAHMEHRIDNPNLGAMSESRAVAAVYRAYYGLSMLLLGVFASRRPR
ncbi:hypothetical protein SAMN06295981_0685 [Corynebacterium pollutisoli]|uniref:Glycosyltransferase 2-like domain-containing protein n=1 Tax=Corynebacterium pollutisoli TaxID=1610489 RepID=A0A1X7IIS7_9CORY|nr:glycosyltransferase family 2 protein [Corynebacterium pollutisoli]SMG14715.1 hypothetical protein SAMN06295981_0685 [Corynebacterium pollutisoli]